MNAELRNLYQEVILDHNRHPRNYATLATPCAHAKGHNPLCGDKIDLYLNIDDQQTIEKVSFTGEGCAISTASASLMTEAIKGKPLTDVMALFQTFHQKLTLADELLSKESHQIPLGKLEVLLGVKEYPARVKCATLAWHTLQSALENQDKVVTTE